MRFIIHLYFLLFATSPFAQNQSLTSLERLEISTEKQFEYNFVPTEKGAFYVTDKLISKAVDIKDSQDNNLSSIYYCVKRNDSYSTPKRVDINFHNHIGSFAVNDKGDFIVFTGRQSKTATTFGLFQTMKTKGKWSEPSLLMSDFKTFNFTDPFLTKTCDTLVFASDMAGGKGGLDLYFLIGSKGNWKRMINLGSNVNSNENERFPTLNKGILYYSSKREKGIGGLDIYTNAIQEGSFEKAVLLYSEINSTADDFSIAFSKGKLFFTSNRQGTDDVYQLSLNFPEFECIPVIPRVRCYEFSEEFTDSSEMMSTTFKWSMGDGAEYEGIVADHCFKDTGTFLIELNIFDNETNELVANKASYELTIADPEQLEILFPTLLKRGKSLNFEVENKAFSDSAQFFWDFGDGQYEMGERVNHTYFQAGSYTISVGKIYFKSGEEFRICSSKTIQIL